MATLIAKIDFFDKRWESGELEKVLCNSDKETIIIWLLANCACSPESIEIDDLICEETIIKDSRHMLNYRDSGMIEEFKLYRL